MRTRLPARYPAIMLALAGAALLAGCGSAAPAAAAPPANLTGALASFGDPASYALTAGNQHTDGQDLVVTHVVLQTAGWVAVHTDINGAPGVVVGVSALLAAGPHDNVPVLLSKALAPGSRVMPVLHTEDKADTTFDYPRGDPPATVGGRVVLLTVQLT